MKGLIAALLLATQSVWGETVSYYNRDKQEPLEYVVSNATIHRTPAGVMPIEFSAFQQIGFDYGLLGKLSHELNGSKLIVTEPTPKHYVAQDAERVILIDTIKEDIQEKKMSLRYLIRMETDKCSIAVDFKAVPAGTNTAYISEVYVRPDNWGTRALIDVLSIFPSFRKLVDSKISDLDNATQALFTKLRENPDEINKTSLSDKEKKRIRSLF